MSQGLLDFKGWKRAATPAFRTLAYMAALYTVIYIVIIAPVYFAVLLGAPQVLWDEYIGPIAMILIVFVTFLAIFKVLDEERPGDIPLKMI
ncbi:MAG: hypothetical protein OEZ01_03940 [Candidatus Heimdallarchaeota archaeon]|nr:hypothetical protein [Candidatus Heimdallarchaeota archaeon]MDH5645130.1 hypothetical protein [Candidatus Heimdallarchaeota archaeon]